MYARRHRGAIIPQPSVPTDSRAELHGGDFDPDHAECRLLGDAGVTVRTGAECFVKVDKLQRRYGRTHALRGVSFEVKRGEVMGLLGANGAGKTTTMRLLCGTLAPDRGHVYLDGMDMEIHPKDCKAMLGYLPDYPPLYPDLTVDEYLAYCARIRGVRRNAVREAVAYTSLRCGIESCARRLIGNLSKGYQQRVGIAQALVHSPRLVVLDEPTVGLDPIQTREIRALIREIGGERSVVLSTHLLPEAQAVCDRVQIIHRGRTVLDRSLRELAGEHIVVRFRQAPEIDALRGLPGVGHVEALGEAGAFALHTQARVDCIDAIVARSAGNGWNLCELTPRRRTLEEIFFTLSTSEDEPGDGGS